MKIRKNDRNNDWCFGNSQADFLIDNNNAIAQDLKTKLQEWKFDFFANLQSGIDWRTRLGYRNQKTLLDRDIKTIITNNENVLILSSYSSEVKDRSFFLSFSVYTIYSELPITIEINIEV